MDDSETDTEDLVSSMFRTLLLAHSQSTPNIDDNNDEERLLNKLRGLVTNIEWKPKDAAELFAALLKRFESTTNDRSHFHSWMMQMLHCIESNYITPTWQKKKTLMELVGDKNVTDEELKKCLAKDDEKTLEEILQEIRQEKLNQIDENLLSNVKDIVSSVLQNVPGKCNNSSQETGLKKVLLKLCKAVEKVKKYRPRLTQMVSWCIMALSNTGRLVQVGTGEGKSCIVAMFAAFRAMRGQKVDVMSSSSVLAERDLDEWKDFYKELKVTVSCNCNKQDEALKKCFKSQVVYGTVEDFAGNWLRHNFQRKDIFGQRKFECAIVDEVDSLMLDKGLHVVYIGSEMPALQHLSPLLAFIWTTVNRYSKIGREINVESSILQTAAEEEIKQAIRFTPCDLSQDKGICYVPGFLSDLVESKLEVWIENAFIAQTMSADHEYVVEKHGVVPVDYSCTGVVENNMNLMDGLQQFLEMKHGSKLSDMTAITNYMSNFGMLQKYGDQIFGMSGTLGKQAETETLQEIYNGIKTCQIPTFKRRKLFEVEGMIVESEDKWIKTICDVVTTQTNPTPFRGPRAVLIIFETISRAKVLHQALDKVSKKRLYVSNNIDNTAIFGHHLEAGEVIIATNLAGRGADLKVSEPVNTAGGLFVVQTFLPKNARVEAQAFGRTARQGAPGSAQLIVCSKHLSEPLQLLTLLKKLESCLEDIIDVTSTLQVLFVRVLRIYQRGIGDGQLLSSMLSDILTENSNSELKTVKKMRDKSVAERLASFSENDIPEIRNKEELFNQYLEILEEVYKSQDNKPEDSYLSALNEFWGMWLLTNFKVDQSSTVLKETLNKDLKKAVEMLNQRESPLSNLHHYTAAGNELREKGRLAECIQMYTKAIETDRCWAAVAYYNRAFASLAQQNGRQDPKCIDQALDDLKNALKSVELYCEQTEVMCRYSKHQIQGLRSESHMQARREVWRCFKANIYEAIKKVDRVSDLGGTVKVEESLVYFLVPLVHLLRLSILSTQSLSEIYSRDPLKILQLISHPSFDIVFELRCLESLGLTHIYTLDTLFSLGGFFSKIKRKLFSDS